MKRRSARTSGRQRISSGAPWEALVGYSRAVRVGDQIFVAGTVAPESERRAAGPEAGYRQARAALRVIEKALAEAGASLDDVVRTRTFVTDIRRWAEFGRAHQEAFGRVLPAATMVQVARFVPKDALVEIEVDAVRSTRRPGRPARPRTGSNK
jgi:enamine deaminase RidA (YjgF/YER057c/UK114 family)